MTGETTFTKSEIFKIIADVYANYINLFQNDRIDFHEFSIVENAIMKINIQIKEKGEKKEEKMTENIHKDCENYNPKKDMCLKWFEENVSERYKVCKEYSEFDDKELSRKWSN